MARKARQLRELEVIEELLLQEAVIPCYRCAVPFTLDDIKNKNIQNEHLHEKALGGADEPFNRRFSHAARPCHATVTHGEPATFAGSSRHKVAKATDPDRIVKFQVDKGGPDKSAIWCFGCNSEIDARTPHKCTGAAKEMPPIPVVPARCRGCGHEPELCVCPKREPRPAFGRRR